MKKKGLVGFCTAVFLLSLVYASTFSDVSQSDFSLGTYNNTIHNGTGVVLSGTNVSGTYTSKIFDAISAASWNNLSYSVVLPYIEALFSVDNSAGIWKSLNQGITMTQISSDYNPGVGNLGAVNIIHNNSGSLFVANSQKLWGSNDGGYSWALVNDDINGAGDSNDAVAIASYNNIIYIIDGSEDVLKSDDNGVSFTKVNDSDFNNGNGDAKAMIVNNSGAIFVVDAQASVWRSIDSGVSWTKVNDDYNGGNGNGATDMEVNSSGALFILDNQDLWDSIDSGLTWNLVNDDFNGGSDSGNGQAIVIDSNYYIYIVDGSEDIYKSEDLGISFTRTIENFNGGDGLIKGLESFVYYTNITFQVRNCSSSDCSDGTWQDVDLDNIDLIGRYFQYRTSFSSQDTSITPMLKNVSLDYTILDNNPPQFSNYIENPISNSDYMLGQTYKFNVTINEANPANIWIEFNGVNYSNGNIVNLGNIYLFNRTNLAAGTYSYKWWANDTAGNINNSGVRSYTVNKADNTLTLLSSSGWDYNYGTSSTFSCSAVFGTPQLYVDSVEVSNPVELVLGAGNHNIKCNISETQNYSSGISQGTLTVNKINSQASLIFDKTSPQIYGTSITPTCSVISGVGSPVLMMNGEIISSGIELVLGAGDYEFNCSLDSSQNYTYSENVSSFNISSVITTTSVIVTPSSGIDYGTESNFSCSNSDGFETILYINGVDKTLEKGLNLIRSAGDYVVNCTSVENQNYSASSYQTDYIINKISGDIKLYLNGQEDNLTVDYPQQYNITATTLYGIVIIYNNGIDVTSDNGNNVTPLRASDIYNITAVSPGDENHSSVLITRWLNVNLDEIAPEINIISPQEGGSYGENTNLSINFSVSDTHLDSCWYNLDNGVNVTLENCANSTFDVVSDGDYTLYLYANDSLGNLGIVNSTFSILVGAPTVILNSPIGIYLNNPNITFRYTPSDLDLQACELWGNFDGEFKMNQTDSSPISDLENLFSLSLPDGTYKWNIRCNDSLGHSAFNGNKTFYVDTISPTITLLNPIGIKKSRTVSANWIILDSSPATCVYNVYRGLTLEIANTSVDCSLNTISFSVTLDADFVFNFYVKDFANNFKSANSSFSVDTSIPVSPPSGGGSSGGGGSFIVPNQTGKLSVSKIGNIIAREGDKKTLSLNVKNTGRVFLNKCRLISSGDIGSWIYSTALKGIAPGEAFDFTFDLNVPLEINPEDYFGILEIRCDEGKDTQEITVSIPRLDIIFINNMIQKKSLLSLNYSFDNSKFIGDFVIVEIWMTDEAGNEVKRIQDAFDMNKEGIIERSVDIDVTGLSGVYSVYFALSSNLKEFVKQSIILGRGSSTGFSIFDETAGKNVIYVIFVILIGVVVFFIWRRSDKKDKNNSKTSSKPPWLLRKKAIMTAILFIPLFFIMVMNSNLTGFGVNDSGLINKSIFGAVVFIFVAGIALLIVLQKRKSSELTVEKYPCITNLSHKKVYTKEGEVLGEVEDITLGDCKIENLKIKLNSNGKKKFNKKGIVVKYNVIDKIGEIVILRDFGSAAKELAE